MIIKYIIAAPAFLEMEVNRMRLWSFKDLLQMNESK
jgi:hypothetical protein